MSKVNGINAVPIDYFIRGTEAVQQPAAQQVDNDGQEPQKVDQAANQDGKGKTGGLVKQLDVLLLQAAASGTGTIGEKTTASAVTKLKKAGLISKNEATALMMYAESARKSFGALNTFTGAQLASAFKVEDGRTVWDPDSKVAEACKKAIDAQNDLSEALSKIGRRVSRAENPPNGLDDLLIEMRMTCDRRATEIQSLAFQMHDFAVCAAGQGEAADPNVLAILKATTSELLPRQALAMHGTADVFSGQGGAAEFAKSLRPLAERIDAFAANSGKGVDEAELAAIQSDIVRMRTAVKDIQSNGIDMGGSGRMRVANDILWALETALVKAEKSFADAKKTVANAVRRNMLTTMEGLLCLDERKLNEMSRAANSETASDMLQECVNFLEKLEDYVNAAEKDPDSPETSQLLNKVQLSVNWLRTLAGMISDKFAKAVGEDFNRMWQRARVAYTAMEEFKALERRMKDVSVDKVLTGAEVRAVFSGEISVSNVVEARIRGLRDSDVDPATDQSKFVSSKKLGAGNAGEVFEVKFSGGETFVFKGEREGRGGLQGLQVGMGNAYSNTQLVVQLNIASKTVADKLGFGNRIVKYSVGVHKNTFGMFMEKAKGMSVGDYKSDKDKAPEGGLSANEIRNLPDVERRKVRAEIRRQLNQLKWLDSITGQLDRNHNNYFVFVDRDTHEVTVKGIDNDASFSTSVTGLGKYHLDKARSDSFQKQLGKMAVTMNPQRPREQVRDLVDDPGIKCNNDGTIDVNVAKIKSPVIASCLRHATGSFLGAAPETIDRDMYNALMALKNNPAQKRAFLDELGDRLSPEGLEALEKRLNSAISRAESLEKKGRVVDAENWGEIDEGSINKDPITVENSSGKPVSIASKESHQARQMQAHSFFQRDQLDKLF